MHGDIPPLPQYAFMAWCLVKHRDKFSFTLKENRNHFQLWVDGLSQIYSHGAPVLTHSAMEVTVLKATKWKGRRREERDYTKAREFKTKADKKKTI
jgi:hypothetical protein